MRNPIRRGRAVAVTAPILAGALALAGCSGGGSDEPVELHLWTWSVDTRAALEEVVLPAFQEEHPDIKVTVTQQPNANYETLLTTALTGSTSPDVVAVRAGILESIASDGAIVALDDVVSSWDGFTDNVLKITTSRQDGKIYAVPQGIQTAQVYYNKTIFAEHGVDVPETWSELIEVAETLKEAGVAPIVIPGAEVAQTSLAAEILGNARRGGPDFEQRFLTGETDMTDPDNVASIGLLDEIQPYLVDDVTAVTLDAAVTLFATGQAAMFPSGTWQVSAFRSLGADLDYGSFDVPADPDWPSGQVTVGYVDGGWALAAKSPHPEQAKVLIDYLTTADFAQAYTNAMGTIPARAGVTLDDPHLAEMLTRYEERASTYIGNAYLRFGTPSGTDLMGGLVQRMWLDQIDAEQAAADYQAGLDAWFDPADFASMTR